MSTLLPTGRFQPADRHDVGTAFEITLRDGTVERLQGADAYQQEQSMTTFFRTDGGRGVDCWSVRMASYRTDEILRIRRHEDAAGPALRAV